MNLLFVHLDYDHQNLLVFSIRKIYIFLNLVWNWNLRVGDCNFNCDCCYDYELGVVNLKNIAILWLIFSGG